MSFTDQNLLLHGDNIEVLKALQRSFAGQIQCVYLDPPYNTGTKRRGHQESAGYRDDFDGQQPSRATPPSIVAPPSNATPPAF